ncbi:unnamed protein product [Linum trigynum]|uniref:Helitron helicase-like domain-containing protein n=1 Tax=Linum trigynum TaxID=586398 RepID=A0AAV2E8J4_9ROSI
MAQWKRRAIFLPPNGPTPQQVAAEQERLNEKIHVLTEELHELDRRLPKMARTIRRARMRHRCTQPNYPLPANGHNDLLSRLQYKRSRILRSIFLCNRRKVNAVPRGFSRNHGFPSVEAYELGPPSCTCVFCGAVMWPEECTYATRSHTNPKFSLCCKQGKVKLPPRRNPPEFLKQLLESENPLSRHFRQFIRQYNGVFCFISLGGKVDRNINDGRGVYVYSIGGQIYHSIGSLLPPEGQPPRFAQLYIHESTSELQSRLNVFSSDQTGNSLRPEIIEGLQEMFDQYNILVHTFRTAREILSEGSVQQMQLKLLAKRQQDGREYDLPTANDVAALIVDDTGQDTFEPDIVVQYQSSKLERVSYYHPSLMALQYPILFPYGEDGWHPAISSAGDEDANLWNDNNLTQCDYYSYRLHTRFHESSSLLLSGKLFQQYVVNAYALVEAEHLDWIRNNQHKSSLC